MASKIKVDQIETADGTGTIALQNQLSGMTTASLPSTLLSSQMPTGSVLQVVQTVFEGSLTTTSITLAATGLACTITPSATSSKILVTVTGGGQGTDGNDVGNLNSIYRSIGGGTAATIAESGTNMQVNYAAMGGTWMVTPHSMQKLDSPNTTSAVQYLHYFATRDAGNTSQSNFLGGEVNMVLMEIAG